MKKTIKKQLKDDEWYCPYCKKIIKSKFINKHKESQSHMQNEEDRRRANFFNQFYEYINNRLMGLKWHIFDELYDKEFEIFKKAYYDGCFDHLKTGEKIKFENHFIDLRYRHFNKSDLESDSDSDLSDSDSDTSKSNEEKK